MTNKNTPAPWGVTEFDGAKMSEVRFDGKLACLMACFGKKATEEDEANLRLIVAAPDLLEACQHLLTLHPQDDSTTCWNNAFKKINEAVQKATGQQND